MIRIDNISFDFKMDNDAFAHELYAKWDDFCRECFENIIEEYLSEYDRKKILLTVAELELDLGTLQEDEFHRQFPIRLKEALQRRLNLPGIRKDQEMLSYEARLKNLIYFLENGFCYTEWADPDFDVAEELRLLSEHIPQCLPELIHTCFNKGYMLERLMMQGDDHTFVQVIISWNKDERISYTDKLQVMAHLSIIHPELIAGMLVRLYGQHSQFLKIISLLESGLQSDPFVSSAKHIQIQLRIMKYLPERLRLHLLEEWKESMLWLSSPSIALNEKRRYLGMILDVHPKVPVRFIHETQEESDLDRMAEILDSAVVRQIMQTESEPHAEVDMPAYWHYLYDWLIEYYPFNGIAIFGDKRQFRVHLNRRLLAFIKRRDYAVYLSKEELTLKFLLEVFGQEHYLDMMNEMFKLQPHNADGLPVYTRAFDTELYRIFLKLSLLSRPSQVDTKSKSEYSNANKVTNTYEWPEYDLCTFTKWLAKTQVSRADKQSFLWRMIAERSAFLVKWIHSINQNEETLAYLAELTDIRFVRELAATVSPYAVEQFRKLDDYLGAYTSQIPWLRGINGDRLSFFIRKGMLYWIGLGKRELPDTLVYMEQFLTLLYLETEGNGNITTGLHDMNETRKKRIKDVVSQISERLNLCDNSINFASDDTKKDVSKTNHIEAKLIENFKKDLSMGNLDERFIDEMRQEPERILVPNAGLVLFAPWFPRLFDMLDLLAGDRKDFKDMESRIRAIFLIQYCVGLDKNEYLEQELAFNRILVGCHFSVPLPRMLELNVEQKNIIDSMLKGVKANWSKMNNTSIKGFQQSFIDRKGNLEQKEEKWVLTVDERAFDILLDSVPWNFRNIRYPWLRKRIYVQWRSKDYPDY